MLAFIVIFTLVPRRRMVFRFFSYSLEDRIEPRHQTLVANRINMKLRYMLTGSDEEFAQRVREAVERRVRFEAGKGIVETSSNAAQTSKEEETTAAAAAAYQNSIEVD